MTDSMTRAIGETQRRRAKQLAHNEAMGITPRSIVKQVRDLIDGVYSEKAGKEAERFKLAAVQRAKVEEMSEKDISKAIKQLEKQMMEHAKNLDFERQPRFETSCKCSKPRLLGRQDTDNVVVLKA
jgi:excinuclease ABC subunit B